AQEFESLYKKGENILFDIRKKSEYDAEHVVGAINVPLNQINQHLAQFPKENKFAIYCAGGYRSMIAGSILKQRGWNNFVDVIGGFGAISKQDVAKTEYVCPTTML
ncbi:MAG TPA: rhodanese-like domain-containing protein, partial [Saprospiraceae bacterium]|nr:rhodanese-like domain-containing protein [Saprospiraceae bacterium]